MKRRWRLLIAATALIVTVIAAPVAYIEGTCRATSSPVGTYRSLLAPADRRDEAQSALSYPEWHIVYEAEAFAHHLAEGRPPSQFAYGQQIGQFWTSYCAVNRQTSGSAAASDAKITIYTIGISFTAELAIKAAYERTIGRLFEWASGSTSVDDRFAAHVQQIYGAFLHETPWYRFPFGTALTGEWRLREDRLPARHWERRFSLSTEYGVKALYAKAIDAATGATVGRDAIMLRFVVRGEPAMIRALDPRFRIVEQRKDGLLVVEAPRFQQFNDLLAKIAASSVQLVEIAGNDRIFMTLLVPSTTPPPHQPVFAMPAGRSGWQRIGMVVSVRDLTTIMRQTTQSGSAIEHIYDY